MKRVVWPNDDNPTEYYEDEVGGCHGGGFGWNPQGVFCGECAFESCKVCWVEKKGEN